MKTTMKHLAAGTFVALLLLVGNVQAEGTETKAASQAIETSLQVEKWMTDETIWNTKSISFEEIAQETESTLEVECWMTCDEIWDTTTNIEEIETELTVENWMTDENNWNR